MQVTVGKETQQQMLDAVKRKLESKLKKELEERVKKELIATFGAEKLASYYASGMMYYGHLKILIATYKTIKTFLNLALTLYGKKISDFIFGRVMGLDYFTKFRDAQYSFYSMASILTSWSVLTTPDKPETLPGYLDQRKKVLDYSEKSGLNYPLKSAIVFLQYYPYYTGTRSIKNVVNELYPDFSSLDGSNKGAGTRYNAAMEMGVFLRDIEPLIDSYIFTKQVGVNSDGTPILEASDEYSEELDKVMAISNDEFNYIAFAYVNGVDSPENTFISTDIMLYRPYATGAWSGEKNGRYQSFIFLNSGTLPPKIKNLIPQAADATKEVGKYFIKDATGKITPSSEQFTDPDTFFKKPNGTIVIYKRTNDKITNELMFEKERNEIAIINTSKKAIDITAGPYDPVKQAQALGLVGKAYELFVQYSNAEPYPFKGINHDFYNTRIMKKVEAEMARLKKRNTMIGLGVASAIAIGYTVAGE